MLIFATNAMRASTGLSKMVNVSAWKDGPLATTPAHASHVHSPLATAKLALRPLFAPNAKKAMILIQTSTIVSNHPVMGPCS